ncbi:MAG: hypothetical protein ACFCD0_23885 [Gemmataceae bacterium]
MSHLKGVIVDANPNLVTYNADDYVLIGGDENGALYDGQSYMTFLSSSSQATLSVRFPFDLKDILNPKGTVTGLDVLTLIWSVDSDTQASVVLVQGVQYESNEPAISLATVGDFTRVLTTGQAEPEEDFGINSVLGLDVMEFLRHEDFEVRVNVLGTGAGNTAVVAGASLIIWGTDLTTGRSYLPQRGGT